MLCLLVLATAGMACESEPQPATVPAPTLAPMQDPDRLTASMITPLVTQDFESDVSGWNAVGDGDTVSEVSWHTDGQLQWSTQIQPGKMAAISRQWPELAQADGLTLHLTSVDRSALLLLIMQEADGSGYGVVMPLDGGESVNFTIGYESFGLQADSKDENGQLDPDQIVSIGMLDFSGFISAPSPNRVLIDEVVLWEGDLDTADIGCKNAEAPATSDAFRVGVDANYVPQGDRADRGYWVLEDRVDPLELFAANGANAFRLRLWVGDKGESKLDYATDLAQRAQDAGLRPYLVLFLSETWSDVNKQPAPADWAGLTVEERAEAIRDYARGVTQHFIDIGVDLDFYEIGNEIDYGIAGVFADTNDPRDPASLMLSTWPDEAQLIQAAVQGIKGADSDARIMLHIANSWSPNFSLAFFKAMTKLGVDYDLVGLSYYPSAFGPPHVNQFCKTLDRLSTEIGKTIVIAEVAYPAEVPSGGMFADWRHMIPGYPLTNEGQAWWVRDLLKGMWARGDILGVYFFGPGFWFSGELWGPFALFDGQGRARPAIASFDFMQ
ncbi:MAG: hypothetical protein GTO14_10340 [Anaerolineales bacterium]|nr:hypothetical protein [Anaerolineales bacterium]